MGVRAQGAGFRVEGLGYRVQGLGSRVERLGFSACNETSARPSTLEYYTWGGTPEPYRGTSLIRIPPFPWDHHRALGIVLLYGPRGGAVSYEQGTPVGPVSYERGSPIMKTLHLEQRLRVGRSSWAE